MDCNNSIITNMGGIPYISTTNTTVGTEAVDFALGFIRRPLPPVGYFTVRVTSAIPTGTTATLPITLTLNGSTRALTNMDGSAVTAADITGTGVLLVFNDRFNGVLQLMNVPM
jgi:hypothetical protein